MLESSQVLSLTHDSIYLDIKIVKLTHMEKKTLPYLMFFIDQHVWTTWPFYVKGLFIDKAHEHQEYALYKL